MSGIRHDAYDIIVRVFKNNDFTDNLLHQRVHKLKQQHPEQIPFLYHLVKGVVKQKLHLDYIAQKFTDAALYDKTDVKIKILLYIGLYQLKFMHSVPDHASVNETVELAKNLFGESIASFVNSVLRSYQRDPQIVYPADSLARIAYEHSYPVNLIKEWKDIWGEEQTEMLAMFFNENPNLHIRVNTYATNSEKLLQYFAKRNIKCSKSQASSNMLICENAVDALDDVAFSEGYFSVQDTSSALIVELLDPKQGESILDLFAAPGGKCTYIAEKMQNTGEVIAVDKIPNRMKLLKQATERLQLTNVKMIVQDALKYGPVAPAYHRVLVDAPCSGWGVFGRKPDLRWQQNQFIEELVTIQEKSLQYASCFVKKNGFLVYSTCTMNPRENERQIENFLNKNSKFTLIKADDYISAEYTMNGCLQTMPYKHFMDGAFAAKLQRIE